MILTVLYFLQLLLMLLIGNHVVLIASTKQLLLNIDTVCILCLNVCYIKLVNKSINQFCFLTKVEKTKGKCCSCSETVSWCNSSLLNTLRRNLCVQLIHCNLHLNRTRTIRGTSVVIQSNLVCTGRLLLGPITHMEASHRLKTTDLGQYYTFLDYHKVKSK